MFSIFTKFAKLLSFAFLPCCFRLVLVSSSRSSVFMICRASCYFNAMCFVDMLECYSIVSWCILSAMMLWYVHFASCFNIDIYCIMGCYYTLCHNTYAYSLLFYKVYIRRENAGSWNSGLEKEQILETYSAQLQKSWNFTEHLKINKEKSSPKMKARGPTPFSRGCPP